MGKTLKIFSETIRPTAYVAAGGGGGGGGGGRGSIPLYWVPKGTHVDKQFCVRLGGFHGHAAAF